jgi:hypothetical protein
MHEYTFDVWIKAVARVNAQTEEEAVERLNQVDADSFSEAGRRGVKITEISLSENDLPELQQVDGKNVWACPFCGEDCDNGCDEARERADDQAR